MMNPSPVMTKCAPCPEEQQFLEDRIYEFNRDQTGQDDGQLFAFLVRGDRQEILGGVSGWTWAHACEIRTLWVHPAWRGQGQGRALLQAAEQEAAARGCAVIRLDAFTRNPAATMLYEHRGYRRAGTVRFRKGLFSCFEKRVG